MPLSGNGNDKLKAGDPGHEDTDDQAVGPEQQEVRLRRLIDDPPD